MQGRHHAVYHLLRKTLRLPPVGQPHCAISTSSAQKMVQRSLFMPVPLQHQKLLVGCPVVKPFKHVHGKPASGSRRLVAASTSHTVDGYESLKGDDPRGAFVGDVVHPSVFLEMCFPSYKGTINSCLFDGIDMHLPSDIRSIHRTIAISIEHPSWRQMVQNSMLCYAEYILPSNLLDILQDLYPSSCPPEVSKATLVYFEYWSPHLTLEELSSLSRYILTPQNSTAVLPTLLCCLQSIHYHLHLDVQRSFDFSSTAVRRSYSLFQTNRSSDLHRRGAAFMQLISSLNLLQCPSNHPIYHYITLIACSLFTVGPFEHQPHYLLTLQLFLIDKQIYNHQLFVRSAAVFHLDLDVFTSHQLSQLLQIYAYVMRTGTVLYKMRDLIAMMERVLYKFKGAYLRSNHHDSTQFVGFEWMTIRDILYCCSYWRIGSSNSLLINLMSECRELQVPSVNILVDCCKAITALEVVHPRRLADPRKITDILGDTLVKYMSKNLTNCQIESLVHHLTSGLALQMVLMYVQAESFIMSMSKQRIRYLVEKLSAYERLAFDKLNSREQMLRQSSDKQLSEMEKNVVEQKEFLSHIVMKGYYFALIPCVEHQSNPQTLLCNLTLRSLLNLKQILSSSKIPIEAVFTNRVTNNKVSFKGLNASLGNEILKYIAHSNNSATISNSPPVPYAYVLQKNVSIGAYPVDYLLTV